MSRAAPESPAHTGIEDWMLATTGWPGNVDQYADALIWLVNGLLGDPKHFYRSFTTSELETLMAQRPADLATRERAREMPIYKRYFDFSLGVAIVRVVPIEANVQLSEILCAA